MKVISQYEVNKLNAGPKAKVDIERILQKEYFAKIYSLKIRNNLKSKKNLYMFRIKKLFFMLLHHYINDIVVYQLPFNKSQKTNINAKSSIGIIHDIEGLRQNDDKLLANEISLYNSLDVIISHNKIMTKYLKKNGVTKPIVNLDMFDYLITGEEIKHKLDKKNITVSFVGNLAKAEFLKELDDEKMGFNLNLYGVGDYNKQNKKLKYVGSFNPDELPSKIKGHLGLVWDGSINNKDSLMLNYTKYNNPHKLSCYLAAGLPVIVWNESAIADFVTKNNIGYTISNIYDINMLSFDDYKEKQKNVLKIRKDVISGKYIQKAITKAIEIIDEGD